MDIEKQIPHGHFPSVPPYPYDQQPPPYTAYGLPPTTYHTQERPPVVVGQPTTSSQPVVIIQRDPLIRPKSYSCLSCLVFWFCSMVFGCIAFIYSSKSSSAADNGDMNEADRLGRRALSISIAGIVVGTITYIGFLIFWLS